LEGIVMKNYLQQLGLGALYLGLISTTAAATGFAVPCDGDMAASITTPAGKSLERWRYPYDARKQRAEGTVLLRVELDSAGKANSVKVAASSGFSTLDRAALKAAKSERFCKLDAPTEVISGLADVAVTYSLNVAMARL
jgi:TonB family protein